MDMTSYADCTIVAMRPLVHALLHAISSLAGNHMPLGTSAIDTNSAVPHAQAVHVELHDTGIGQGQGRGPPEGIHANVWHSRHRRPDDARGEGMQP